MNATDHDSFVKAVCAKLDACAEQTAPEIEARLNSMRAAALTVNAAQTSTQEDKAFINEMQYQLAEQATVPPVVADRLNAARKAAVANMQDRQSSVIQSIAARIQHAMHSTLSGNALSRPMQMVATACVMVTAISVFYISLRPAGTYVPEEELALIAATEDFELVENLDFYMWLAENGLPE